MLDEIELLVGCRRPEVIADHGQALVLSLAFAVHDRDRRLLPERRIGEHHVEPLARVSP